MSGFELLAKLQHHGAATRLIDVSRNMLVALWFTCRSQTDQTGILLGWHSNTILGLEGRPEERGIVIVTRCLATARGDKKNRCSKCPILYSTICSDPMSSLAFEKEKGAFLTIVLTTEMKSVYLRLLEDSFDVRQLTLFSDIDSFCYANSENFGCYSNERW